MQYRVFHNHNISVLTYDRKAVRTPDLRSNGSGMWLARVTPADVLGPSVAPSRFVREPIFFSGVHCGRSTQTADRDGAKTSGCHQTMGTLHRGIAAAMHTCGDTCGGVRDVVRGSANVRCRAIYGRVHAIDGAIVDISSVRCGARCMGGAVLFGWKTKTNKQLSMELTDNVIESVLKRLFFHFSSLKASAHYLFLEVVSWRVRWWFG